MKYNDFDQELKYRLYRTIPEIIHPTISKKNISDYKIIISEEIVPVRIFYPKKVSNIEHVFIFIPGSGNITNCSGSYSDIASRFALEFNQLVISFDYGEYADWSIKKLQAKLKESFQYIYKELVRCNINAENITLIGDSTGANIILSFYDLFKTIDIKKQILFYPILSGESFKKNASKELQINNPHDDNLLPTLTKYYQKHLEDENDYQDETIFALNRKEVANYPQTLLICGNVDPFIIECREFNERLKEKSTLEEIPFGYHGFLKTNDQEIIQDYTSTIKAFLVRK